MLSKTLLLCGLILSPTLARADGPCLTTCRQIADKADSPQFKNIPFCITGVVSDASILLESHYLIIRDETGSCYGNVHATNMPSSVTRIFAGDLIRAAGCLDYPYASVAITNVTVVRHGPPPRPPLVTGGDILSGQYDYAIVRARGIVRNVFADDTNPDYAFVVLNCDGVQLYAATTSPCRASPKLVGTRIELIARCMPNIASHRRHIGYILYPLEIKVVHSSVDTTTLPDISSIRNEGPIQIAELGRHQATGRVVALWERGQGLLQFPNDDFSRVEFNSANRPQLGRLVRVIGYPATDLYTVNLTSADWTYTDDVSISTNAAPVETSARDWMQNLADMQIISSFFHGQTVRLSGVVRDIPREVDRFGRLILDADGTDVLIDASANPDIVGNVQLGSTIRVTGVCVRDVDNWRPNAPFPKIRRIFVVPRTSADIETLVHPPILTVKRLMVMFCLALFIIVAILIWNRILKAQVERRTRQLLRERIVGVRAQLKVDERTRIAVELHDTLSQDLAGVTFELDAARALAQSPAEMTRHLTMASRALASCRSELRNCLWDLRNNTLGGCDMNEAIRRSLVPLVNGATLQIRFNVPRSKIADDLAHAIIRIVRELVSNALRHGKATIIRVAGVLADGRLEFSVRDNGCGFGPDSVPGPAEGHFGLQGIRERIRHFGGQLTISSESDGQTRVTISMKIPGFDAALSTST